MKEQTKTPMQITKKRMVGMQRIIIETAEGRKIIYVKDGNILALCDMYVNILDSIDKKQIFAIAKKEDVPVDVVIRSKEAFDKCVIELEKKLGITLKELF